MSTQHPPNFSMDQAAESLDYESAAECRDQIASIKDVQARQVVSGVAMKDADALAVISEAGTSRAQGFQGRSIWKDVVQLWISFKWQ